MNTKRYIYHLLPLAFYTWLSACSQQGAINIPKPQSLPSNSTIVEGKPTEHPPLPIIPKNELIGYWQMIAFNGVAIPRSEKYNHGIAFNNKGRSSGYDGCNSFGGKYYTMENKLRFGLLLGPLELCEGERAFVSPQYYKIRFSMWNFEIQDNILTFQGTDRSTTPKSDITITMKRATKRETRRKRVPYSQSEAATRRRKRATESAPIGTKLCDIRTGKSGEKFPSFSQSLEARGYTIKYNPDTLAWDHQGDMFGEVLRLNKQPILFEAETHITVVRALSDYFTALYFGPSTIFCWTSGPWEDGKTMPKRG